MSEVVLLTGATGFLGAQIARRLIAREGCVVVALVRAADDEAARRRLARAWWDWPALCESIGGRVRVVCGDVAEPRLGLDALTYDGLVGEVTHIVHSAADLRLHAPLEALRRTNVGGTAHVLDLARDVERDHGLGRLAHVSTAYVCGARRGEVPEDALSDAWGFSSAYEESKFEGERLVRAAVRDLPITVLRPGMIVGDSRTGEIRTFNTCYYPLRLYLTGATRVLPADPDLRVNLVPVDYVADAVARLAFDPRAEGRTVHLTAPYDALPTARELAEFARVWAREHLGLRLPRPLFLPLPGAILRGLSARNPRALGGLLSLAPYLRGEIRFRRDEADRLLGPYTLDWRAFLPAILAYAARYGFMHRSERTAHEQILQRLGSRSRPVTLYDIAGGQVTPRSGADVRREMLRAASALRSLGIGPGDRVAIVGLNSTRYLVLDVAIGLVGAVSVPLYYTSPPADIDPILRASGAKMLCIGAPQLLERLGMLEQVLPVVSFLEGTAPRAGVLPWEEFLARGDAERTPPSAPVGMDDLATLRYSSGTTGRPKGVMFTHGQLRWMGECLPALLPWRARHEGARYLSCLPMNHVVEGILATYAPYYIPAPLDIYFLQDLHDLARALPEVRPTVFFSVPRVYEKVWERLGENALGRRYLSGGGPLRGLLRPLVRRGMLRRAGLDRCAQLLVGSAPASEGLLRAYRDLGVEVHNAYGLTEAPLVTMNRLGANRLGTVGAPLPETEVRIAEDGEILVRGPQVTPGYYGEGDATPLRDGWLATGDLGRMSPEGSLEILGRKKELIKTAYGKYVHPAKVESRLKEIPGVAEAMLVGEGRPYCAALVWVAPGPVDAIDRAVRGVNAGLAHPEQVKRWALLPNDLSTERGDLTANLKLKRHAVAERLRAVVGALYGGGEACEGALHIGAAER